MTEHLEALLALAKEKTMAAAANRLRVTPSAVSKRIAHLEEQLGYALVEPEGRQVRLTPAALRLVERLDPLLAELKAVLSDERGGEAGEIEIGVSESVLSSWGAGLLTKAAEAAGGVKLRLNAHRSPVVLERVRSGEYALGICAGAPARLADLRSDLLLDEPLVLIPQGLKPMRPLKGRRLEVVSIESHASTWESLKPGLRKLQTEHGIEISIAQELQSFSCVVQLARAGFSHALAPEGIAAALGVPGASRIALPGSGLTRSIRVLARPTTLAREGVRRFYEALLKEAAVVARRF